VAERIDQLALDVRPKVERTMRLAVLEGSLAQVFLNWTTGSVLVGFMLHLGATPTELALVSSVPFLSQLASPIAAFVASAMGRRRALTVVMMLASRLSWVLAAALPMFDIPEPLRPLALVGIGFNVQHDGNHGTFSRYAWVNRTLFVGAGARLKGQVVVSLFALE
jgi:hypothetical protein